MTPKETIVGKVGETVMIYADPLDCRKPEGRAVLRKCRATADVAGWYNGSPIERWDVEFLADKQPEGDPTTYQREILFHPGKQKHDNIKDAAL